MADTHDETGEKTTVGGPSPAALLRAGCDQLTELTGVRPESVVRFQRTDDGWLLEAEVVEVARVPETMSLLGLYEITLDPDGLLTGYRRVRRYERARGERR
ncbi:gas vesicle protein [Streptomyces sp. SAJ15]|uniref:gas vesicle protein GvpO n=1 Tax=Streptomyces sp. SAJ15 TaxID=2011095 RepID=UPI001185634B|nr:gas vesicle protein [Streptomyces sp. SAJ15]TVL91073.1 gas vesicle protein [Streptomyces sp. SAJ15]